MLPLPGNWSDTSYRVRLGLRQLAGRHGFHLMIPVGDRITGFEVDSWEGKFTGLCGVKGKRANELPGAVAGRAKFKDSEPHELEVSVRLEGANAKISALLDTKRLTNGLAPSPISANHRSGRRPGSHPVHSAWAP